MATRSHSRSNGKQDWVVIPDAHEPLVARDLFRRAHERRSDERKTGEDFRRGRGKDSPFLLTSLLVCKHCGFKLQGFTHRNGYQRTDGTDGAYDYVCGGYRSKGRSVCKRYRLRRDPFEHLILGRVEKPLMKYLARGGEGILRKFIAEEILAKTPNPGEEITKLKSELTTLETEANRLLDIATPANRDFVDERLGKIRVRRQELEPRLADLERVDFQPVDLEAATRDALAYLARFRDVLEEGTLEQRKEFLRGFVHEISIDPDTARGVITFYELPVTSLMMVPGVGVEPTQARGPRDFKATGERQRTQGLANSLPFPVSEESEEGRRVRGLRTPRWTIEPIDQISSGQRLTESRAAPEESLSGLVRNSIAHERGKAFYERSQVFGVGRAGGSAGRTGDGLNKTEEGKRIRGESVIQVHTDGLCRHDLNSFCGACIAAGLSPKSKLSAEHQIRGRFLGPASDLQG
jgi:Recombinase zinc beta ribbon domain